MFQAGVNQNVAGGRDVHGESQGDHRQGTESHTQGGGRPGGAEAGRTQRECCISIV